MSRTRVEERHANEERLAGRRYIVYPCLPFPSILAQHEQRTWGRPTGVTDPPVTSGHSDMIAVHLPDAARQQVYGSGAARNRLRPDDEGDDGIAMTEVAVIGRRPARGGPTNELPPLGWRL
jgi:hypothetical protein